MQLDAIYDNGRLTFTRPVRFLKKRFNVRVEVSEQEILELEEQATGEQFTDYADEWLARVEAIKQKVLQIPEEELPPLTEKQEQRLRAFALREDR